MLIENSWVLKKFTLEDNRVMLVTKNSLFEQL